MGSVWRIYVNFPKLFTQTSCSALRNCLQRIGTKWAAANMRIPLHHKIYSRLDGAFHSSIWKPETPKVHKVCVKDKLLLMLRWGWCGLLCSHSGMNVWHYWSSLTKHHASSGFCRRLLLCVSHFTTASISSEAYLHVIFVEWVQRRL